MSLQSIQGAAVQHGGEQPLSEKTYPDSFTQSTLWKQLLRACLEGNSVGHSII